MTAIDTRFLDMREAAFYLRKSYRWMQRHYLDLVKCGVKVCRVPKFSERGRLLFERESLDRYIKSCQIVSNSIEKVLDV